MAPHTHAHTHTHTHTHVFKKKTKKKKKKEKSRLTTKATATTKAAATATATTTTTLVIVPLAAVNADCAKNVFFCSKLSFKVSMITITQLSGATALAYQFISAMEPLVYTRLKHSCN